MEDRKVELDPSQVSKEICDFEISLAKLSMQDGVEDAVCAGSGTLVAIGSVHGVLTAAHVLNELPNTGSVAVVLHRENSLQYQRQTIDMQRADKLVIYERERGYGPSGPDLGFLRLPLQDVGWLKATNIFYNLSTRRNEVLAGKTPGPFFMDDISGMIHELTKELPPDRPLVRMKRFQAIFCGGKSRKATVKTGYDLFDFEVLPSPGFALPASFEGASGGAIWRLYCEVNEDEPIVVGKRLHGVPFHQTHTEDGKTIIAYHGPKDIYGLLIDKVTEKWPEEAAAQ
jgi:hypothetical protein